MREARGKTLAFLNEDCYHGKGSALVDIVSRPAPTIQREACPSSIPSNAGQVSKSSLYATWRSAGNTDSVLSSWTAPACWIIRWC